MVGGQRGLVPGDQTFVGAQALAGAHIAAFGAASADNGVQPVMETEGPVPEELPATYRRLCQRLGQVGWIRIMRTRIA